MPDPSTHPGFPVPPSRGADATALVGRLLLAALFLLSGIGKLSAPAATIAYIGSSGMPLPMVGYVIAVAIEIGGGVALVTGFNARYAAAALAVFSLATGFAFHYALSDQNQFIHFWKNIAITGGMLQVVAFGPGRFALGRT